MKKIKILVTGGPVHANLDAVKIITNRFKGGRIAEFADDLESIDPSNIKITYLTSKGSRLPDSANIKIVYHSGFEDYREKVLSMAPRFDGVILGAAVCNLIPLNPIKGKFPSHNYKVGDKIPIDFTIAPRIIDEVKKVAPKTKLFGFKLLQGVSHEELINAAYDIVLESKAVMVFANDANNLDIKYAVTKEKGEIPFLNRNVKEKWEMAKFVVQLIEDEYYSTKEDSEINEYGFLDYAEEIRKLKYLLKENENLLRKEYGKERYKFGTVAVRIKNTNSFVTTVRGKKDLKDVAIVKKVDHRRRKVYASKKATLNAPLLHNIFKERKDVKAIVHYHAKKNDCITFPYKVPGTKREAMLGKTIGDSKDIKKFNKRFDTFYIEGHGTFELITE